MSEASTAPTGEDPIKVGSFLFTIVEPNKGHQVEYNRWYERDHFYSGCMIGPWTMAGKRFVATRDCKALREPAENPITGEAQRGSYVAIYWILAGRHKEWIEWSVPQVHWLHKEGRMFAEREHVHTMMYRIRWTASRDADGIPPELALDHPFAGIAAVVGEVAADADPTAVDAWYQQQYLPGALAGSPAALVVAARPLGIGSGGPSDVPQAEGSDRRFLHLYFLQDDPRLAWKEHFADHGEKFAATGLGKIVFTSPFLSTIPGTDVYTDELW